MPGITVKQLIRALQQHDEPEQLLVVATAADVEDCVEFVALDELLDACQRRRRRATERQRVTERLLAERWWQWEHGGDGPLALAPPARDESHRVAR